MLSPEQLQARKNKLTASRVAVLMTADAEGIMRLYEEMIGDRQPESLDHIWAVRLGQATEQLSLDWFEEKNKVVVTRRGEVVVHPDYPWAAATLDGFIEDTQCCVEAKHVGGREPLEVILDRYAPQIHWQMFVTKTPQCALSVIMGANEPVIEYIERDNGYIDEMFKRAKRFMVCVHARLPPVTLPAVPPPVPIDQMIEVDMSDDETWRKSAGVWLQTHGAKKSAEDAEKMIKHLVGANVRKAWGAGIRCTRDKANRLSLREDKQ